MMSTSIAAQAMAVPAEPVNARLLEALIQCRDRFLFYVEHHLANGAAVKAAENDRFVTLANQAIAAAEAQQEQLLQDMHDAGRKAAITEAVAPWKSAVIEHLIIAHILTAEHESDPLKALQDLLAYHTEIAVDPRVSGAAAKLVEQAKAEEREACAKVLDEGWFRCQADAVAAIRARGQK